MSRLSAIQNINKKYSVAAIRPFGGDQTSGQVFTPNSVINRGTPVSQVIRRSQVTSNIVGGPPVQIVQESVVTPPMMAVGPVVETIERTEVYPDDRDRRISVNESRGVRPKEYWESSSVVSRTGNNTPIISRVRRGYIPDDGNRNRCRRYCNWTCCLWTFFAMLLLVGIGFALNKAFGNMFGKGRKAKTSELKANSMITDENIENQSGTVQINNWTSLESTKEQSKSTSQNSANVTVGETPSNKDLICSEGFFIYKGKCLSCPPKSFWNGTTCVMREVVTNEGIKQNQTSSSTVVAPSSPTVTAPINISSGSTSQMDNTTDQLPPETTTEPTKSNLAETKQEETISSLTPSTDTPLLLNDTSLKITPPITDLNPSNTSFSKSSLTIPRPYQKGLEATSQPLATQAIASPQGVSAQSFNISTPTPNPEPTSTPSTDSLSTSPGSTEPSTPTTSPTPQSSNTTVSETTPEQTLINPNNITVIAHQGRSHLRHLSH